MTPHVENSKFAESDPSFSDPVQHPTSSAASTPAVSSTLPADPVGRHAHIPTQIVKSDRESAVDTQSDVPFQFDNPSVTAPLILPQRNSGDDHRDDLPHHIRTQLSPSRIRKPAQGVESDAEGLRLDAGKRTVLMLSHDVSFCSERCKPVTAFKSCDSGERATVLLPGRAACKEARCDTLTKSQQGCMDAATTREWDKRNEFGVTKFLSKGQLNDSMKRNSNQKIVGARWVLTEKVIHGKQDYKARFVVQVRRTRATSEQMHPRGRETPSS